MERNSLLIMDNARIHHASSLETTWNMIKETYGIDVLYLPPYSPFLNPIEYAFNDLKSAVKASDFYNNADLEKIIIEKLQIITPSKFESYNSHVSKFFEMTYLKMPFHGNSFF